MPRFTRDNLLHDLQQRKEHLKARYFFCDNMGIGQLGNKPEKERVIAYGRYQELRNLLSLIEGKRLGDGRGVVI